jgi:DUF4097 and DUF4098 domain-containing protein YvlB
MGVMMKTFEVAGPIAVSVELVVGTAHVIASDRRDAVVAVNPADPSRAADVEAAAETRVELVGGRLVVEAPRRHGLVSYIGRWGRTGSIDVVIEVPEGSQLEAEGAVADFRSDGLLGDVRVKTSSGEVNLDQAGQCVVATGAGAVTVGRVGGTAKITGGGELRLTNLEGHAVIKNLNGRTWIGEAAGDLRVKSANGDITVERARSTVGATTANGSIQIGEVSRGAVAMKTASGSLEVGIREGSAAWLDVGSTYGRVRNTLTAANGPQPSQDVVEVRAHTAYGDITIHRA